MCTLHFSSPLSSSFMAVGCCMKLKREKMENYSGNIPFCTQWNLQSGEGTRRDTLGHAGFPCGRGLPVSWDTKNLKCNFSHMCLRDCIKLSSVVSLPSTSLLLGRLVTFMCDTGSWCRSVVHSKGHLLCSLRLTGFVPSFRAIQHCSFHQAFSQNFSAVNYHFAAEVRCYLLLLRIRPIGSVSCVCLSGLSCQKVSLPKMFSLSHKARVLLSNMYPACTESKGNVLSCLFPFGQGNLL